MSAERCLWNARDISMDAAAMALRIGSCNGELSRLGATGSDSENLERQLARRPFNR